MGIEELKGIMKEKERIIEKLDAFLLDHLFLEAKKNAACDLKDLIDEPVIEYENILKSLRSVRLTDEFLNDDTLKDFIYSHSNNTFNEHSKRILGLYTGALLQVMTQNNEAAGRGTRFFIDGRNNRFDHLFSGAEIVDELILTNFYGSEICRGIGSTNGRANNIILDNIKGTMCLYEAGAYSGNIKSVVLSNSRGWKYLAEIGSKKGSAELIISINNTGELGGAHIGDQNGKIGLAVFKDSVGEEFGYAMGNFGEVNTLIVDKVDGRNVLKSMFGQRHIRNIFLDRSVDMKSAIGTHGNVPGSTSDFYDNLIFLDEIKKLGTQYSSIDSILALVNSIDTKDYNSTILKASDIAVLHKQFMAEMNKNS